MLGDALETFRKGNISKESFKKITGYESAEDAEKEYERLKKKSTGKDQMTEGVVKLAPGTTIKIVEGKVVKVGEVVKS